MTTLSVRDESFVCIALACLTPLWRLMPLPFPALNSLVFNTEQKRHFALGVCVHVREFLYIASKLRTGQTPFKTGHCSALPVNYRTVNEGGKTT